MGCFRDLAGSTFDRWSVVGRSLLRGPRGEIMWLCRCACGVERDVLSANLTQGLSRSCGCLNKIGERSKTHGHTTGKKISPTYHSWAGMKARCSNPNNTHYKHYGLQGVSVCDRWNSFDNFFHDMGEKPKGTSIDRIDPSGNYEPNNCRWATPAEQANNKKNSRMITAFGQTMTLQQWANHAGVTHGALIFRIDKAGWPLEKALSTPSRGYGGRKPQNHPRAQAAW